MQTLEFSTLEEAKMQADVAARFSGFPIWWVGVYQNHETRQFVIGIRGFKKSDTIGQQTGDAHHRMVAARWGENPNWADLAVLKGGSK